MTDLDKTTFTLAEAAKLLSCHPETLRRAIKVNSLKAASLGRGFRISRPDLQTFWTECGGGDLFEKTGPDTNEAKARREQAKKDDPKKRSEPQQLILPT